ncbi:hypothetical protein BC936DRAFT_137780, partial [Jimgerdemannia flammicorona]
MDQTNSYFESSESIRISGALRILTMIALALKIFDLYITNCNIFLILDNYNIYIYLDELSVHIELRNTTVFYLSPNMISKIQLCDISIICNFKTYYHYCFNCLLL